MLYEYQVQCYVKPVSEFEGYCKLEGLDHFYIRSSAEEEKGKQKAKKGMRVAGRLFSKWTKQKGCNVRNESKAVPNEAGK